MSEDITKYLQSDPDYYRFTCPECHGQTIMFSGKGLDIQYKICSRWEEARHKTRQEIEKELAKLRHSIRPSGRFA